MVNPHISNAVSALGLPSDRCVSTKNRKYFVLNMIRLTYPFFKVNRFGDYIKLD